MVRSSSRSMLATVFSVPSPAMLRLVVCLVGVLPAVALADAAFVKGGPGGVYARKNKHVQMVAETIEIDVQRDGLFSPDNISIVTVTYLFRSHSARPLTLDMGFPVVWDAEEGYAQVSGPYRFGSSPIKDFTVTVDGVPTATKSRRGLKISSTEFERRLGAENTNIDQDEMSFDEFHVWPVAFEPHGERTVVNRYRFDAKGGGYEEYNHFSYVLRTGALWLGMIERLTMVFRFHDRGRFYVDHDEAMAGLRGAWDFEEDPYSFRNDTQKIAPAGAKERRTPEGHTELVWNLTHLKPAGNLVLDYVSALEARQMIRGCIERLDLKKTPARRLQRARETLDALHGRTFDDPAIQKRFAAKSWYVADPDWQRHRAEDPVAQKLDAALPEAVRSP